MFGPARAPGPSDLEPGQDHVAAGRAGNQHLAEGPPPLQRVAAFAAQQHGGCGFWAGLGQEQMGSKFHVLAVN